MIYQQTLISSVTTSALTHRLAASWPWYISRASGLVAVALLVLLALSGIGQFTGITYRIMEPLASWSLHRALAIAFGVSIIIHGGSLLFDTYQPFNVFQLFIPFLSKYQPVTIAGVHLGSLYVAFGIIASYFGAILIFTSLYWINTKQKIWHYLHYLSYPLVVLALIHGLYVGTDLRHGTLRSLWWLSCGLLIVAGVLRLIRVGTIHKSRSAK